MTELLSERYHAELDGVLSCYDRIIITGSLQPFCYAQGMTHYLYQHGIRIFDYPKFAEPLRDRIRANAEALAEANGVKIEFVRKKDFRKENRIQKILKERGEQPGLVHIFGAMEACSSYRPWHDKVTGKTYLKPDSSKCMTYYFYFMDQQLGLCYVRVPTWCPFRLQFYFNGHSWLANQLKERGIAYEMVDNAFVHIADYAVANKIANEFDVEILHLRLDELARQCCPVITDLSLHYHWSIMQAEYATDLVFKNREALQAFYPHLLETLTHVVKPADIATFLGRKLNGNYQGEMGNRFNKRWLGTRIKHQMGPLSIKMYDKFRFILRIEALIQSMQDGLILSDLKGTVVYANRRIGELADLTPEDLRGASIERVLTRVLSHASDPQRVRQEVENLLEGKSSKGVEFSFLNPGRTQYFRLDKFSVTDTRHVPIGRGLILRDITTDKELDRMKSSLVSTVSHELRTPLAAIKGYATTLLAEDVEWDRAAQREFLTMISDEADRLTLLVNNLLDLSRIEAGSLALSWEECRIEGLIQRAAAQAHLKAGSGFKVQIEAGLPKFYADRPRLETVLRNLLENAVKYGGSEVSVQVSVQRQGEQIVFRVSDDGPGIPPEESQRIFESFYRIDDSLTRVASGAGLGLAICQGFVRAHGGEIWVEKQEKGACIAFSIPLLAEPMARSEALSKGQVER